MAVNGGMHMKTVLRLMFFAVVVAMVLVVAPLAAWSQAPAPQPPDVPRYDLRQEVTIKGTVLDVKDYSCPISGTVGTHLTLKTSEGEIVVHLAAANFAREYGIQISKGVSVELVGMKTTFRGEPAFLPRIVKINNDTYFVREKNGKPLW
jgi:DNA/RNA endonuclease YhcR with UshA esterase domain